MLWKTIKTYEVLLPSYVVRIIWQFRNHNIKKKLSLKQTENGFIFSNFRSIPFISVPSLYTVQFQLDSAVDHSFSFFEIVQQYFVFRTVSCAVRWQPLKIIIIFPSVSLTFAPCFKMVSSKYHCVMLHALVMMHLLHVRTKQKWF